MMPDREKVIKGLECCTFILGKRKCNECPYQKGLPDNGCYQLQDDFHALLKEQEAKWIHREDMDFIDKYNCTHFHGMCTNCGLVHDFIDGHTGQYKYCPQCGQAVKWE